MITLALSAATMVLLFLVQGFLLQLAVALTGDPAPRYGRALFTTVLASIVGGTASVVFGLTAGLAIALLFGRLPAAALSGAVLLVMTALVVKARLRSSFVQALAVTLMYELLAALTAAGAWFLVRMLIGIVSQGHEMIRVG
jgi:hypothetical protein